MRISALLLASCVLVVPGVAYAGPCSDQIAELSRMTGGGANPATTGATSSPGASASGQAGGTGPAATAPAQTGTGKQTVEQHSATREMSAVAGQIATSPEDVRRQQEGRPTTAQASDQLPVARAKLEQARLLDEQGKGDCMALVNEARAALQAK